MFACNIYIKASEAQIDEYSACTGRLSRTTDDLGSASELYRVIGLSPSVNTIIYLGLQPQHRLHTDKNTQQDLLNVLTVKDGMREFFMYILSMLRLRWPILSHVSWQ